MNGRNQPMSAWHSLGVSEVAEQLEAGERGLSEDTAAARLAEFGPNKLPQKPPTPPWAIVLRQFRSPLIYILALAAGVSLAIGDAIVFGIRRWRKLPACVCSKSVSPVRKLESTYNNHGITT